MIFEKEDIVDKTITANKEHRKIILLKETYEEITKILKIIDLFNRTFSRKDTRPEEIRAKVLMTIKNLEEKTDQYYNLSKEIESEVTLELLDMNQVVIHAISVIHQKRKEYS